MLCANFVYFQTHVLDFWMVQCVCWQRIVGVRRFKAGLAAALRGIERGAPGVWCVREGWAVGCLQGETLGVATLFIR